MALISPAQAAERSGFSPSQIRRMICKGILKAKKVGMFYVIDEKDIKSIKRRRKPNKE